MRGPAGHSDKRSDTDSVLPNPRFNLDTLPAFAGMTLLTAKMTDVFRLNHGAVNCGKITKSLDDAGVSELLEPFFGEAELAAIDLLVVRAHLRAEEIDRARRG